MYFGQASGTTSLWEFQCVEPDDPTQTFYAEKRPQRTKSSAAGISRAVSIAGLVLATSILDFFLQYNVLGDKITMFRLYELNPM